MNGKLLFNKLSLPIHEPERAPPDFFPHSQKEMISLDGVGSCDSESSSCSPEIGSQGRKNERSPYHLLRLIKAGYSVLHVAQA